MHKLEDPKVNKFKNLSDNESIKLIAEELDNEFGDFGDEEPAPEAEGEGPEVEEAPEEVEEQVVFTASGFDAFCNHVKEELGEEDPAADIDRLAGLIQDAAVERAGEPLTAEDVDEILAAEEEGEGEEETGAPEEEEEEASEEGAEEELEF